MLLTESMKEHRKQNNITERLGDTLMKYILNADEMKKVDAYSIGTVGIPSVVLMERAALSVTEYIEKHTGSSAGVHVICICGSGNNGADGLAAARQLFLKGYNVNVFLSEGRHQTEEYKIQLNIIRNLGIQCIDDPDFSGYEVIVDALFGNGLSRGLENKAAEIVDNINKAHDKGAYVVAVDIPSGISATSGMVLGCAVKADVTVTFGYTKAGQLLYPGAAYCGKLITADIGFAEYKDMPKNRYVYEESDVADNIIKRKPDSNKGSCGKALIIAGSRQYGGAAVLASEAAYRMGAGLVKLITHSDNRNVVLNNNVECLLDTYNDDQYLEPDVSAGWADAICIGPGLSQNDTALKYVRYIAERADKKRLFDADALNIIADKNITFCGNNVVVTPHIGEMSRLTGKSIADIKSDITGIAVSYANEHNCICVLKDARTIVTDGKDIYINISGNDGMATGGSGDVLSGIITSLMAQGMDCFEAAKLGVYIHGLAGDVAADKKTRYSMVAGDIIKNIPVLLSDLL